MYNPIEKKQYTKIETQQNLTMLAKTLDLVLNGPVENIEQKMNGFVLLIFPFGQPEGEQRANYISNADREDIIAMMKEFIARSEGRMVESGAIPPQ